MLYANVVALRYVYKEENLSFFNFLLICDFNRATTNFKIDLHDSKLCDLQAKPREIAKYMNKDSLHKIVEKMRLLA